MSCPGTMLNNRREICLSMKASLPELGLLQASGLLAWNGGVRRCDSGFGSPLGGSGSLGLGSGRRLGPAVRLG